MTWQRVSCVVGACDDCGTTEATGFEGEPLLPHFRTVDEAVTGLTELGWIVTGNARLICPSCQTRRGCYLIGHAWGPWRRRDGATLPDGRTWSGTVRHCDLCCTAETDPPIVTASPPEVAQP